MYRFNNILDREQYESLERLLNRLSISEEDRWDLFDLLYNILIEKKQQIDNLNDEVSKLEGERDGLIKEYGKYKKGESNHDE